MPEELRIVATAGNETEAEMIGEWLSEAGIRSMPQLSSRGIRLCAAAERDIYVEARDYDRALEVINGEAPSEAELAALSEAAATRKRWEFMLTVAPLPIPNGTGSPVNPIAMF